MTVNLRSLRVRLCLWYVLLSMVSMTALGVFSYVYLFHALASSREKTMQRREARLMRFIEDEQSINPNLPLREKLHHFMLANADTDILQVTTMDGTPVYGPAAGGGGIAWTGDQCAQECFSVVDMGTHRLRTLQHIVRLEGKTMHLTMAGIVDEHYDILKMVESSYLIFLPLMLLASIAGGFMLSHRALEPVDRITRAARTLGINDLHRRLPVPHTGDELQRLAETWNELLERLERAVKGLTQLTSDVSHDLRTTITVMLATAQLALSRERTNQQYREAMQTIMQECQSTTVLLNDLLAAARADAPEQNIELLPVPLNELVREVATSLKARAETKQQDLYVFTDDELYVLGDASLLRRLITILLDNAIKYTGTSGRISMVARKHQQYTVLEVCDTGIGIAPEDITRIFDRFYRVDSTRSRNEGGHGLGLAIAKWIADVHDADIRIRPNERQGTVFEVRFAIRKDGPRQRDNRRELATLSR